MHARTHTACSCTRTHMHHTQARTHKPHLALHGWHAPAHERPNTRHGMHALRAVRTTCESTCCCCCCCFKPATYPPVLFRAGAMVHDGRVQACCLTRSICCHAPITCEHRQHIQLVVCSCRPPLAAQPACKTRQQHWLTTVRAAAAPRPVARFARLHRLRLPHGWRPDCFAAAAATTAAALWRQDLWHADAGGACGSLLDSPLLHTQHHQQPELAGWLAATVALPPP